MGIIKKTKQGTVVIEAVGPVKETPIGAWINRGRFDRFAVYRLKETNNADFDIVFDELREYYGRPYDIFFSFDNNAIYCSELVDIGYTAIDIHLGRSQKASSLLINLPIVKSLIRKRIQKDPACQKKSQAQCAAIINDRELVTPVSIARDKKLFKVYSNYPF